jgi:hypothetical protein
MIKYLQNKILTCYITSLLVSIVCGVGAGEFQSVRKLRDVIDDRGVTVEL